MSDNEKEKPDAETLQFMADLEQSIQEAKAGIYARVHTPEMIKGYEAAAATRGRPVGSTKKDSKEAVTVRYSKDVLEYFRATGKGWQTRMNDALRKVIREELRTT